MHGHDCPNDQDDDHNDDQNDHDQWPSWDLSITCPRTGACTGKINAVDHEHDKIFFKLKEQTVHGTISDWNQHTGEFTYVLNHDLADHVKYDQFTFWLQDCYGHRSRDYSFGIKFEEPQYSWTEIVDSFERDSLFSADQGFGWRYFIQDHNRALVESQQDCLNRVCAKIFAQKPI